MKPSTRHKTPFLAATALFVGGVVAAFAIAETGMRVHYGYIKRKAIYLEAYLGHESDRIVFVRKPSVYRNINRFGFRDHEWTVAKPEGTYRILVLGDSVTNGYQMSLDDRFTNRLQSLLTDSVDASGSANRFEVLNMGTDQYATIQEVAVFEQLGRRFDPDLVILAYVLNDPTPDGSINEYFRRGRAASMVADWLSKSLDRLVGGEEDIQHVPNCESFDYYSRMHCDRTKWGTVVRSLNTLRELADTDGFEVVLLLFPLLNSAPDASFEDYRWSGVHSRVLATAESLGFDSLDLLEHYRRYSLRELKISRKDMLHPNVLGHDIAAKTMLDKLATLGVLPGERQPSPASDSAAIHATGGRLDVDRLESGGLPGARSERRQPTVCSEAARRQRYPKRMPAPTLEDVEPRSNPAT